MIYLKPKNRWLINQFAKGDTAKIQSTKLRALYRLIQLHGEPIEAEGVLNGIMALEFAPNEYVAIRHTPVKKDEFYPCKIVKVHLETSNTN